MSKYRDVKDVRAALAVAALLLLAANPANAAFDLVQGGIAVGTAILTVFGVFILVMGGYKAIELMQDHRPVVGVLLGMVFAIGLCFGGAYWLTTLGAGTGAPAITL